jgi:hypothetical protein
LGHFNQHLYQSTALLATLAGTVATFVYAKDYVWIPLTFLCAFVAAALSFCLQMHKEAEEARHEAEEERRRASEAAEAHRQQLADAEARASSLVVETLQGYQRILTEHSWSELTRLLSIRMEFVKRMRLFAQSLSNPIEVRKIESFAGRLFVIAKVDGAPMKHLKVGDPFFLVEQTPSGPEIRVALLQLNQPPDPVRKAAHFLVTEALGEAADTLESVARAEAVEAVRRYQVRLLVDIVRYRSLHIEDAIELITLLAAEAQLRAYRGERP